MTMSNFGALTDHFGILAIESGEGTLADVLTLTESSAVPDAQSRANAEDENGDIAASSFFGNSDGALKTASTTFSVNKGELSTALLKLGQVATGKVVETIAIGTDNQGWPTVTVGGKLGAEEMCTDILQTFALPAYTIKPCKRAQLIGFTVGVGCKLTSSELSASVTLAQDEDGLGEPVAHGVSGGEYTVTANFVRVTAAPSWTVSGNGLEETQEPGVEEGQAAYHTATATAAGTLTRETA